MSPQYEEKRKYLFTKYSIWFLTVSKYDPADCTIRGLVFSRILVS